MTDDVRGNWSHHIDQIVRSKHYTWIAEGLAGVPLRDALLSITTDLMHICRRNGLSWEQLLSESQQMCEREEAEIPTKSHAA